MSDQDKRVQCDSHGETAATFVCVHLAGGTACGYHGSSEDDRWPDAWCDLCEAAFQREGEWNDANEPKITLLCTGCYDKVKSRNATVLPPLVPGQVHITQEEWRALVIASCERASLRQEIAKHRWPRLTRAKRWHYDPDTRTIRFFDSPTGAALVADVTITGSFSTETSTWMWAWGNEEYAPEDRARVSPVAVFGEVRGIEKLANAYWEASEVDGWEVTQVAADLLGAQAIYRAPFDHLKVFMLLNGFRIESPS